MDSTPLVILMVVLALLLAAILGVAIWFLVKLLKLRKLLGNELMPLQGRIAFWAALIYTVFPVDLMVDPIYADDIGVMAGAVAYITHLARKNGLLDGNSMRRTTPRRLPDSGHVPPRADLDQPFGTA